MDLFDKFEKFTEAREAMDLGLYPYFLPLTDSEGAVATFNGRRVIMIGSNNYLGLTTHPRLKEAAKDAVDRFGTSCTGSRFMNGTLELHLELDQRLADFVGKEAALVFSTGYQTNLGTISALIGKNDFAVLDKEAHACCVDGAILARGDMKRFVHNDMDSLRRVLSKLPKDSGKLIVVDGVYSMGGDLVRLPELVEVAREFGARILLDDAHGIGVMAGGRGTAAHFGLTDEVDLIMGTFSKSFASVGGFIAGTKEAIHYIKHHARSVIFSASLPAPNVATALAALDIMENEPEHNKRLWENTEFIKSGFHALGYNTGNSETPVIPLMINDYIRTGLTWKSLLDNGVYTNPVVPPGVPPDQSLLRTSYMATHTRDHLTEALRVLEMVGDNLDLIPPVEKRMTVDQYLDSLKEKPVS